MFLLNGIQGLAVTLSLFLLPTCLEMYVAMNKNHLKVMDGEILMLSGDIHNNYTKYPLLLKSNTLIDTETGIQLNSLIKPLQDNRYNYRDEQCINTTNGEIKRQKITRNN